MSRVFLARELEGVATFWRVHRRDGLTLGFTGHDRDLWFDGVLHRAAPGMVPSALRRSADLTPDSAEIEGALAHDAISGADLAAGRYDGARVAVGAVDWETCEHVTLYGGTLGRVSHEGARFVAELQPAKAALDRDFIPRTSPTCRAEFCGPGCTLSAARFESEATVALVDLAANRVAFDGPDWSAMAGGRVRWVGGPHAGTTMQVVAASITGFVLDRELDPALEPGMRAVLREGCDKRLETCAGRFANAVNFQGEPYLPGNDLLVRYPSAT